MTKLIENTPQITLHFITKMSFGVLQKRKRSLPNLRVEIY